MIGDIHVKQSCSDKALYLSAAQYLNATFYNNLGVLPQPQDTSDPAVNDINQSIYPETVFGVKQSYMRIDNYCKVKIMQLHGVNH